MPRCALIALLALAACGRLEFDRGALASVDAGSDRDASGAGDASLPDSSRNGPPGPFDAAVDAPVVEDALVDAADDGGAEDAADRDGAAMRRTTPRMPATRSTQRPA